MIESYRFGRIIVDGVEYDRDLIILPGRIKRNWWRVEGHQLRLEDLTEILESDIEILVVGQGAYGMMKIGDDVTKALAERGIKLFADNTERACEIFNEFIRIGKKTAAALHLTC
ncbi:MAG: MTH938/NDUFAF3 family protein [Candidatus Bathyarchaeia archaeon]